MLFDQRWIDPNRKFMMAIMMLQGALKLFLGHSNFPSALAGEQTLHSIARISYL